MNCMEAAEYVSALFDGEPLSRDAAAHLSDCEECRTRLNDYAEIGAELREVASTSWLQTVPPGQWKLAEPAPARNWLRKWRGTMRIPRFVFALMLIAILALSGGLTLVKARPGGNGPVLLMTFKIPPKGQTLDCGVRMDQEPHSCMFFRGDVPGDLALGVKFIKREGERVQLGIKSRYQPWIAPSPERTVTFRVSDFDRMPEQEYWLEPGKTLSLQVGGLGSIEVSGEFLDHMPVMTDPNAALDPVPGEFRLLSPVLIRDNQVVVKISGSSTSTGSDPGVFLYSPRLGRFIFSPVPFPGAVEANLQASQISFTLEGQEYLLLSGAPITRSEHVWVLHQQQWRPTPSGSNAPYGPFVDAGNVQALLKIE